MVHRLEFIGPKHFPFFTFNKRFGTAEEHLAPRFACQDLGIYGAR